MDIVDTQVHANQLGIDATLAIMDALGIQGVLVDEYAKSSDDGTVHPAYRLANGEFRVVGPNAEAAALLHPERFAFLMRVNPLDPRIEGWIETLVTAPGFKAIRATVLSQADGVLFASGGYDRLLAAARAHGLPVFVTCPRRVPHLAQYAQRFPDLQFVIDHCGAAFDAPRGEATIDDAIALARYPNVALKWAHAPSFLAMDQYPFADLNPKLRRAVDAFGVERVMWASDYTESRRWANWGETLFSILDSPVLSEDERSWILGRTARRILDWPAPQDRPRAAQ
jgi:predicted TIM-barrel fold metal-dependent hydrolase